MPLSELLLLGEPHLDFAPLAVRMMIRLSLQTGREACFDVPSSRIPTIVRLGLLRSCGHRHFIAQPYIAMYHTHPIPPSHKYFAISHHHSYSDLMYYLVFMKDEYSFQAVVNPYSAMGQAMELNPRGRAELDHFREAASDLLNKYLYYRDIYRTRSIETIMDTLEERSGLSAKQEFMATIDKVNTFLSAPEFSYKFP